jgi:hypothetical protein
MPGPILHAGTLAKCPHGGTLTIVPASPRVAVGGTAAVITDKGLIKGCTFTLPNGKPQPCVTTLWTVGATRVKASGVPVLINPCVAECRSVEQIPGGPPIISGSQTKVVAT